MSQSLLDPSIDLSKLEFCNLAQNSILMLPLDIETMSSLTHLLSAFNMIAELPENLYTLKSLQTLDVYGGLGLCISQ